MSIGGYWSIRCCLEQREEQCGEQLKVERVSLSYNVLLCGRIMRRAIVKICCMKAENSYEAQYLRAQRGEDGKAPDRLRLGI